MASVTSKDSKPVAVTASTTIFPPAPDDGIDSVLFVYGDDEEEDEGCEWGEGDDEEDECYYEELADDEEEDEEEDEHPVTEERRTITSQKMSKRFRRHQFLKHEICIPDKGKKVKPPPKQKPWYLKKKIDPLEKRQDSRIVFVMPKQEDAEVLALRKTNKMVQKLMKYMRKSWKIRVNRKQEERELEHRTLVSVYTKKPDEWLQIIRQREERSLETGFFSPLDIKYEALIDLELDTALLVFKNLPPDLKITAARWIRARLRKEELKRKRDAYLPRIPHGRVKRPSYKRGRLLKDAGGVDKVDQFVRVSERFYKVTKGSCPFSKVLREWSRNKEKENSRMNTGFGIVREGMFDYATKAGKRSGQAANKEGDNEGESRRVSIVDARKYQRDMLLYEKFIVAIYDIMKSLLNIRMKQLESKFPLPPSALLKIRSYSPDTRRKGRQIQAQMQSASIPGSSESKQSVFFGEVDQQSISNIPSDMMDIAGTTNKDDPGAGRRGCVQDDKRLSHLGQTLPEQKGDIRAIIAEKGIESVKVEDLIDMPPLRSTAEVVDDIKKELELREIREQRAKLSSGGKGSMTAEDKIKRLTENPEYAAIRRARNYTTYMKLFERNKKMKRPVWHEIDVAAMTVEMNNPTGLADKDPANLTEQDAAEVVELALKKRQTMERKGAAGIGEGEDEIYKRWPDEFDIPTPTFPFPHSRVKIPSEEQSRQSLLKKTPHINEVPGTPLRRLYKLAGVRTTELDIFNNIIEMKKMFRVAENKVKVYYENEIGKIDWDTTKRFRSKLRGMKSTPVFEWTIALMRADLEDVMPPTVPHESDHDEENAEEKVLKQKRPALWYKKLREEADVNGALRHNGCHAELQKLLKYCDVDMKTKPHMLNRLALLIVSLPTTELATPHWQKAFVFLLEHMFGSPPEIIRHWLDYRGLPFLL